MLKRKPVPTPFASTVITKKAYDLSNVRPEDYRKEIKNYIMSTYPFTVSGLGEVNYKKPPDEDGNAIGSVTYEHNGVSLQIPIIVIEHSLKEPNLAIYKDKIVPLDEEYLEYVVDDPEYGNTVDESALPGNMQYIRQSGLFQEEDTGLGKMSGVIGVSLEEDTSVPYHYTGAILKHAKDGSITTDHVYCSASEMLALVGQVAEYENKVAKESMMRPLPFDKRISDMPMVQKITESGEYENVMVDRKVIPGTVLCNLFDIGDGAKDKVLYMSLVKEQPNVGRILPSHAISERNDSCLIDFWAYGIAHGSGYSGDPTMWTIRSHPANLDSVDRQYFCFMRKAAEKHQTYITLEQVLSVPYYCDAVENVRYGDEGNSVMVLHVKRVGDGKKRTFIVSDQVAEPKQVNLDKIKNSDLRFLYNDAADIYVVPATYKAVLLGNDKKELDAHKDGYFKLSEEIAKDYPNTMTVINKGAGYYTITIDGDGRTVKHADKDKHEALLVANHYTGQKLASINDYESERAYAFKGDISIKVAEYIPHRLRRKHKGEFNKLASYIRSEGMFKQADIENTVNELVGIDASLDDERVEKNGLLHLLDDVIQKVGELVIMSRIGKNDLSEAVLGRAVYALVKLSNEIRGQ